MQAAHLVPELALARVVTAGGPYRPGDEISLAFTTPSISRLVAHDAELRATCLPLENALVPEMISVIITHTAAPYAIGDVLTLSFVDPRIARVYLDNERQASRVAFDLPTKVSALDETSPAVTSAERFAQATPAKDPATAEAVEQRADARSLEHIAAEAPRPEQQPGEIASAAGFHVSDFSDVSPQINAGERMTLEATAFNRDEAAPPNFARRADNLEPGSVARTSITDRSKPALESASLPEQSTALLAAIPPITMRLEWHQERLRRFVQVVDKLFTIDRLGWYRHSLAMRLLIPDEIACGDTLAGIEAMRHLQALRAAAVESLGKPLLAACMPAFSMTSEWLETLESPREARAISGLREALLPFANDDERAVETPPDAASFTTGGIARRELLAEAASVEAFLPLLIATASHDAAVSASLAEYRRLLVELFTQTARAGEPVRVHQMAQANHSLDDRLWQVVGAVAEAFGGFAHT